VEVRLSRAVAVFRRSSAFDSEIVVFTARSQGLRSDSLFSSPICRLQDVAMLSGASERRMVSTMINKDFPDR
jgi:hypothetical protein